MLSLLPLGVPPSQNYSSLPPCRGQGDPCMPLFAWFICLGLTLTPFLPFPGHHSPAMRHYSLFYLFFWRFWSSFIGQSVSRWPNLVNNNMIARRSHGTVVWNVTWENDFGMVVAIIWRRIGMEAKIMCRDGRSEARKFSGGNMLATSVSVRQYPPIASAPKISSLY